MLNLRNSKRICILGGGTAGWFSALFLRKMFNPTTEIMLISTPEIPIVGVGEGGVLNLMEALQQLEISLLDFMQNTGAVHKLGFVYEGWRTTYKDPKDYFYHMFPLNQDSKLDVLGGYIPLLSMLVNHSIPVSYVVDSIQLREQNISQAALTQMFVQGIKKNFSSSFHFDAFKVGQYLKKIALQRQVIYKEARMIDVKRQAETGHLTAIEVEGESIAVDFVIDASGFSRQIIGHHFKSSWESFKSYLTLNTAIPFHLKHQQPNPDLVTRSTALDAGWVWQIPLNERIGAGYVFNRDFITEDQAVAEVEQWLGHEIEPIRTIKFDPGVYKEVWQGNVMALGLASSFVEPLEATSIGQMLEQLFLFKETVFASDGIISQKSIDYFNQQNLQAWHGIRDFIRMHYDTGRTDTAFWQDIAKNAQMSEHYKDLKECWQHRTPRRDDLKPYRMEDRLQFGIYSWLAIAQALEIVHGKATVVELLSLAQHEQQEVIKLANQIQQKINFKN